MLPALIAAVSVATVPSAAAPPPAPSAQEAYAFAVELATAAAPACDTWLVATGSEERPYTKQPDHLGRRPS